MSSRLLQIMVPDDESIDELLEDCDTVARWVESTDDNKLVLSVVVSLEAAEEVMDRFEDKFKDTEGFRIVVLAVEAMLPIAEMPEEGEEGEKEDEKSQYRVSRAELYGDIEETLGVDRIFIAMTALSAIVAAIGLLRNDVAIIIGAMVIAPLLGPNMALALATTLADPKLLRQAIYKNAIGIAVTFFLSVGIGMALEVDPSIPAIEARLHARIGDIILALAAGTAGTLAFTRGLSGAVIGVMVAVALMPPLVAFGLMIGSGNLTNSSGAITLLTVNLVCINIAAIAAFMLQSVKPRSYMEGKKARKATRIAASAWVAMLVGLLLIIYWSELKDRLFTP